MFDLANTKKRVMHTRWQYDWQTDLPRIREVINSAFEANDILEGFFPTRMKRRCNRACWVLPSCEACGNGCWPNIPKP